MGLIQYFLSNNTETYFAWLLGLGTAAIHSIFENSWIRIRPAIYSYTLFAFLQIINLARYPDAKNLDWSAKKMWVYVFFLASILFVGLFGTE